MRIWGKSARVVQGIMESSDYCLVLPKIIIISMYVNGLKRDVNWQKLGDENYKKEYIRVLRKEYLDLFLLLILSPYCSS